MFPNVEDPTPDSVLYQPGRLRAPAFLIAVCGYAGLTTSPLNLLRLDAGRSPLQTALLAEHTTC